jgi:hypothetical protein
VHWGVLSGQPVGRGEFESRRTGALRCAVSVGSQRVPFVLSTLDAATALVLA